ncbi:MAG: hypothetical protein IPK94_08440 [Saprospiraceae bacterium]|nr:hypothetical protein [Saprospiraceae bacterium]
MLPKTTVCTIKLTSGNTIIEFRNNWLGEGNSSSKWPGRIQKIFHSGIDHPFTIMENRASARYIQTKS